MAGVGCGDVDCGVLVDAEAAMTDDCILWTGARNNRGYGVNHVGNTTMSAARAAWIEVKGELPWELVVDHLCRTPLCVNVDHLEPVTRGENTRRAPWTQVTHCKYGHPLSGDNLYIQVQGDYRMRRCRECQRIRNREWSRRKAAS